MFILQWMSGYLEEKLHQTTQSGKEDFIQDYCNREERLNSILLKINVGGFLITVMN